MSSPRPFFLPIRRFYILYTLNFNTIDTLDFLNFDYCLNNDMTEMNLTEITMWHGSFLLLITKVF
jgi:hypothetical protein